MMDTCQDFELLISGLLDNELKGADRARLMAHLETCAACREEFDKMKRLVSAASNLTAPPLPEEVWNAFLEGVYNRLERRTGWTVLIVGLAILVGFGAYQFIVQPWGSVLEKVLVAMPVIGVSILFDSVLRERLAAAQHDRYSREVIR
jgi:anti-sigma factor RsiW